MPPQPLVPANANANNANVSSSSSSSPKTLSREPPLKPTPILPTPTARAAATAQPLLLLAVLAAGFSALVADPVGALGTTVAPLAVVQGVFVGVCLPVVGGDEAGGGGGGGGGGIGGRGRRKGRGGGDGGEGEGVWAAIGAKFGSRIIPAILSLTLPILPGTPLLALLLVLFGAPATTHLPATLLTAAHMALLAGPAVVYVRGTRSRAWSALLGLKAPVDGVVGGVVGVGLGAWVGAVPIPLDWDRPWQTYPVTIVTGAYVGYAIGSLGGRLPGVFGRVIQLGEPEDEEGESKKDE